MKHPSERNCTTEKSLKQALKALSFKERKIRKLSKKIDILNKEAMSLIGNNDAYYANRMAAWTLVDKIVKIKEVY